MKRLLLILGTLLVATSLWAGMQDFQIINNSPVTIYDIYVRPHGTLPWGKSKLGWFKILSPGDTLKITFPNSQQERYWDIRWEDENGIASEEEAVDLGKIGYYFLYENE